jgi:hypothetical protein
VVIISINAGTYRATTCFVGWKPIDRGDGGKAIILSVFRWIQPIDAPRDDEMVQ